MKDINKKLNIILSIIIVILLIVIFFLVFRKTGDTIINNQGTISVFEIKCEATCLCPKNDENKCNTNDNTKEVSKDTNNNSNNNNNTNNTTEETEMTISVFDNDKKWQEETDLKIFENSSYTVKGKIAPESIGTYQFVIKNTTNFKVKYNLEFTETNTKNIDMKYKLKKNNEYIISNWVTYSELKQENIILNSNLLDTYTLEWKWFEGSNDNAIGSDISAKYGLLIDMRAEQVNE